MKKNRLARSASPYLRQHATNPVDWYPWGEEAFAKARGENKPILLSIGYSTCHWCHVMERESFENEEIAAVLNEFFVAIKLDREERPDIDKVYMTSYQAMTEENGGWPLNVFLTPELTPFFGGTYFPPVDRGGRVGFKSALLQLEEAWRDKRDKVVQSAAALREHLQKNYGEGMESDEVPEQAVLDRAAVLLLESADQVEGGWGSGPKFPMPSHLSYLLRSWKRTGDEQLLNFVGFTADMMVRSGMMDQLGGGFHRYAVDGKWLVPHFEKMLYDQAQLLDVYLDLYQITQKSAYAEAARKICDYVLNDMRHEGGAFFCAEDAQSEGKEGKFFCWTKAELVDVLDAEELELACSYFGITEEGNFYDHSDPEALKNQNVLSVMQDEEWLNEGRKLLLESVVAKMKAVRAKRVRPGIDDKVLASWNGMMIGALARAGQVLGVGSYFEAALRAHGFIHQEMWDGERLAHRWHQGGLDVSAQAESYLLMLQSTRRLYEMTLDSEILEFAVCLAEASERIFFDEQNGGFFESAEMDDVMVRLKGDYDGAMPTASGVAAMEFLKLAMITGEEKYRLIAERTLKAYGEVLIQTPTSMTNMLQALDFYYSGTQRLVLVAGENGAEGFYRQIVAEYRPQLTVMGNSGRVANFEKGLQAKGEKTTAYFCVGESCRSPVTEVEELEI
ncbi:thioredoxin domain-containing protein [Rubritalea spongiae]|uniref:Thioredoxin domain-containing protein n=1 Tax=Rubritalea spongiae TaxID=430797 RepID=A0ABW5E1Y2_9BACT